MTDITQIKIQLASRAEAVARHLLPNGQKHGHEWCVGSIGGERGQSLKVCVKGDKAGVWSDFAASAGGDLLDLYCAVNHCDLVTALQWAKGYLNIQEPDLYRPPVEKPYQRPQRPKNVTVPQSAVLDYLTAQRGLTKETLQAFQVGELAEMEFAYKGSAIKSPAIVFPFKVNDELLFLKYLGTKRPNPEKPKDKLIKASANCEPVLFGWQALPATTREVLICEGEINAMSWHQLGIPALATPFGAGKGNKHAWIACEWERLQRFERIYLNFDPDDAGRESIGDLTERLGRHRCLIVPPMLDGHKDANDCLLAGIPAAQMSALVQASQSHDPEQLRRASEFLDDVLETFFPTDETHLGVELPVEGYGDKIRFRLGETTLVTGFRGHGKTETLNMFSNQAMLSGERVCVASFEMKAKRLLHNSVRQMTGQREPSSEYIKQVVQWYYDRLWIYDHVGRVSADAIFEVFEYAYRRYGVRFFIIDSLMKCGIKGKDSEALLAAQDDFANRVVSFGQQFNVHMVLVAHARKEADEDHIPRNNSVKGSGGIPDQVDNVMAVWRNKPKERAIQKSLRSEPLSNREQNALNEPDAYWAYDKQRGEDGWIGDIPLWFDPDSKQFVGEARQPRPLLPFQASSRPYHQSDDEYPEF